ncbi:MAG: hypothetical protein ABI432_15790 [Flavobacteriales bacterium]
MRILITSLVCVLTGTMAAQDLSFQPSPSEAMAYHKARNKTALGTCVNDAEDDSMYHYNAATDSLEMIVEKRPLMRKEYYADGTLYRQIEIRTGGATDLPMGYYVEYFPNGAPHFSGRVNGSDSRGQMIKTGTWTELDLAGRKVHQETFK